MSPPGWVAVAGLKLQPTVNDLWCAVLCCAVHAGMKITPGSGIGKAIEYWQSTSKVIPTRESNL